MDRWRESVSPRDNFWPRWQLKSRVLLRGSQTAEIAEQGQYINNNLTGSGGGRMEVREMQYSIRCILIEQRSRTAQPNLFATSPGKSRRLVVGGKIAGPMASSWGGATQTRVMSVMSPTNFKLQGSKRIVTINSQLAGDAGTFTTRQKLAPLGRRFLKNG